MIAMEIKGYMVEVSFDGEVLRASGTNKVSKAALADVGDVVKVVDDKLVFDTDFADVEVPVSSIAEVQNKRASMMTNGNLKVTTTAGRTVQLHYRKKSQADFDSLESALKAARP